MAGTNNVERTFSPEQHNQFAFSKTEIINAQVKSESLARSIAYHLTVISDNELYLIDDPTCKGIGQYAEATFGIKKSTVSEAIATFKRFGDSDTQQISDKYAGYKWSSLIAMNKLTDEFIKGAEIEPKDSRETIKSKVSAYNNKLAQIQQLPETRKAVKSKWNELVKEIQGIKSKKEREGAAYRLQTECKERFQTADPNIDELDHDKCMLLDAIITRVAGTIKSTNEEGTDKDTKTPGTNPSIFSKLVFDMKSHADTKGFIETILICIAEQEESIYQLDIQIKNMDAITDEAKEILHKVAESMVN